MTLTQHDIADHIRNHTDLSLRQSREATKSLLEIIKSTLASGEHVLVSGFGKLCVKEKAQRKGRNPATGQRMILPARRIVTFKRINRENGVGIMELQNAKFCILQRVCRQRFNHTVLGFPINYI